MKKFKQSPKCKNYFQCRNGIKMCPICKKFQKRLILSYFFTVPAFILIWVAEKIRGGKIAWRYKEVFNDKKIEAICSKCGHKNSLTLDITN